MVNDEGEGFNQFLLFMGLFVHVIMGLYEHKIWDDEDEEE